MSTRADWSRIEGGDESVRDWRRRYRGRIEALRDRHRGETCFLLGNGSSLRDVDLDALRGASIVGMNKVFLKFRGSGTALTYYVAISGNKISANADEIAELDAVCFLSHRHWSRMLLPETERRLPIYTIGDIGLPAAGGVFEDDLTRPLPSGNMVSFVALQIVYFLGYARVVMLGFDHRFNPAHSPNTLVFEEDASAYHFDPEYHRDELYLAPDRTSYDAVLRTAREHFEAAGRRIVNATPDSALDVFPRVSPEEALTIARERTR